MLRFGLMTRRESGLVTAHTGGQSPSVRISNL